MALDGLLQIVGMERDERILLAATDLFYSRGFDAVGVDMIGVEAGVTGPAIYRHFKGKDEILATLFDRAVDALLIRIGGEFETPQAELEHLVVAHATFVIEHRKLARIWAREDRSLSQPYRTTHQRRERHYVNRWSECLGRCFPQRDEIELAAATAAALGLLNSVGDWPQGARRLDDLPGFLAGMVHAALDSLASD